MVDSVNSNTGSTPVNTDPSTTPVSNEEEVQGVSSGFSEDNSTSHTEGAEDTSGVDSSVDLDSPGAATINSVEFLQKSFDARLTSFSQVVSDFNARFNPETIDLSDTRTLLMTLKGVVSDMRALLSAQTIGQDASNRSLQQQQRLDAAREQQELKAEIRTRQQTIDSSTEQYDQKSYELAQKQTSKLLKEHQLTTATANGDTALVNQLQAELAEIQLDITLLEHETANLSQAIQQLEAENLVSKGSLAKLQQVIEFVAVEFVNVKQVLEKVRERYDAAAIETGEEQRLRTRTDNQQAEANQNREGERLLEKKARMKESLRADIADEKATLERQQKRVLPQAGLAGLSQNQLGALASLFPPEDPAIILQKLKENPGQVTPAQTAETTEALSLVLQAEVPPPAPEPSVTATEENPGDQPYLGDNLSLEGANNPQAFALLLRDQNMEQLVDKVHGIEQLLELESLQNEQILELMSQLQWVDGMVAEALEEAAVADAVIRRSPV